MHLYKLILITFFAFISFCGTAQKNNPAVFIENKGQWDKDILYRANLPSGFLFLKENSLQFSFYDYEAVKARHQFAEENQQVNDEPIQAYSYEVVLLNAQKPTQVLHYHTHNTPYQYFLNKQIATKALAHQEVLYKNIYDKIDLRIFKTQDQKKSLKYEFIVQAGGDYRQIKLQYRHSHNVQLIDNTLRIVTPFGTVKEAEPISFQKATNGKQKDLKTRYVLDKQILSFEIEQAFSKNAQLVIDPELIFSTFSGSFSDNWGNTATYDEDGNLYSGGIVFGNSFPTTTGAFDVDFNGNVDMGIIKYNADGSNAEYITYLGGSAAETPHSLVVDTNGDLLIFGTTSSSNYPTTAGAMQTTFGGGTSFSPFGGVTYSNGSDIVVSRLSNDGTALLHSTYIGGNDNDGVQVPPRGVLRNYGDAFRGEIVVDEQNNIYIATSSYSNDFPTLNAYKATKIDLQDAVVMKILPDLSGFAWSTFLGGLGFDFAHSVKLNAQGEVYVGGATLSTNFPTSANAMLPSFPGTGNERGFITQFDNDGNFLASTYLGTSNPCQVYFIDLDPDGNVYALGNNRGTYPVSLGVYSNPNSGQFIHKITGDLSTSLLSTTIGSGDGRPDISPTAFLVNECGNIYLTGWGGVVNTFTGNNSSSSTNGLPITPDAFESFTDGSDFYIMVLEKDFNSLLYATYFGGSGADHVDGGTSRFGKDGTIYHATCSCGGFSDNFPTTPNVWSPFNNSFNCNNAAFKFNTEILVGDFSILDANTLTEISEGCASLDVVLRYEGIGAREAIWEIGNLATINQSTVTDLPFTFAEGGIYNIKLTVKNQASCTKEIVVEKSIEVFQPNFTIIEEQTICFGQRVTLQASGVGNAQYTWSPTDNIDNPNIANPTVNPTDTTTYQVEIVDENGCTSIETVRVNVLPEINASFSFQLTKECGQPQQLALTNTSQNADRYTWLIDDVLYEEAFNPTPYTLAENRPYKITLIAYNALCEASFTEIITPEYPIPFSVSENTTLCEGESTQLEAKGALTYQWSPTAGLDNPSIANPIANPDTTTIYTVTLTDATGCQADSTVTITVVPKVKFDVQLQLFEECGKPTTLQFTNNSLGADKYVWDLGDGNVVETNTPEPHIYEQAGNYVVSVNAFIGDCIYNYQQTVEVLNTSQALANVITPNGDGLNDTFELIGSNFQIEIFNRWGKLLYKNTNYQNDWGNGVETGVYYYIITSQTGQRCKGWLQVLK